VYQLVREPVIDIQYLIDAVNWQMHDPEKEQWDRNWRKRTYFDIASMLGNLIRKRFIRGNLFYQKKKLRLDPNPKRTPFPGIFATSEKLYSN
jgi:hypothetical protein